MGPLETNRLLRKRQHILMALSFIPSIFNYTLFLINTTNVQGRLHGLVIFKLILINIIFLVLIRSINSNKATALLLPFLLSVAVLLVLGYLTFSVDFANLPVSENLSLILYPIVAITFMLIVYKITDLFA